MATQSKGKRRIGETLSVLVVLLSLFAVTASAQPGEADSTLTPAAPAPAPATAVAAQQTTPPPATAPTSEASGRSLPVSLGVGAHYMETVGSIKDAPDFDTSALNLLVGARKGLGLITLELDSEWAFDFGGSSHTLWMPQAFALLGPGLIYAGAGIGTGYIDGEWFDNPTYALRAGVNLPLGRLKLDVNAAYQFMSSKSFETIDSEDLDSITFGALLWF